MKITKRDVSFFFLGILTLFLFELITDWDNSINDFKKGFNEGSQFQNEKELPKE